MARPKTKESKMLSFRCDIETLERIQHLQTVIADRMQLPRPLSQAEVISMAVREISGYEDVLAERDEILAKQSKKKATS